MTEVFYRAVWLLQMSFHHWAMLGRAPLHVSGTVNVATRLKITLQRLKNLACAMLYATA